MKNQFATTESGEERAQIHGGKRIHQKIAVGSADLHETNLLGIGMQTVGLGINGQPRGGVDDGQKGGELFLSINHGRSIVPEARGFEKDYR